MKSNVAELLPRLAHRYKELVTGLAVMPSAELSKARRIIAALVGSEIVLRPTEGKDGLEAELTGLYAGLYALSLKLPYRVGGP